MTVGISQEKVKENFKKLEEKVKIKLRERIKSYDNSKEFKDFINLLKQDEKNKKFANEFENRYNFNIKRKINNSSEAKKIKGNMILLFFDKIDELADKITEELYN